MNDRKKTKGHKECKCHEYKQNSQYLWNIIILLQKKHLSFSEACLQMNATILIKLTRRNIQLNKSVLSFFVFGTPWPPDLLCKHWFTLSVWNFCLWVADVHPRKNILSGGEWGETAVFADYIILFSVQRGIQPKMRPAHLIFVSKCWSASQAKGFCNSFCIPVVYAPR